MRDLGAFHTSNHHLVVLKKIIHSPESRVLTGLLRQLRKDAGLTQGQLADELGVQRQIITSIERGERMVLLLEIADYVQPLGVTTLEFLEMLERELRGRRDED